MLHADNRFVPLSGKIVIHPIVFRALDFVAACNNMIFTRFYIKQVVVEPAIKPKAPLAARYQVEHLKLLGIKVN